MRSAMSTQDVQAAGHASVATPLSAHEHRTLVREFNDTAAPYPSDTIVGLFAAQVARTPDRPAVSHGERSLTYRELDDDANHISARVCAAGAGPGHFVVVWMEHSIEVVSAILGVLKAGAAYVPLDPSIPKERLAFVLRDLAHGARGAAPIVVTQPHLAGRVPGSFGRVVAIDNSFAEMMPTAPQPRTAIDMDDLAYVIYTSGSTGIPKGVAISHRSLVNYVWWANAQYSRGEQLTWPLFTSLAFDLTVTSIFTPIITGGRIVVYTEDPGGRGMVVFKVIKDGVADIVKLTPSHLSMIKDLQLSVTPIRRLIVGGEDFKTDLARRVADRFGRPVEIYNEYGPTEATVGCMLHRCERDADETMSVPIGRPAANARVYVLDEALNLVAPGVAGEIYLAGDGLAQSYFNRPDLTARAFVTIADPRVESGLAGRERVYRTGDFARWTPEGRLEFLGRADDQVKIGGVRIELGEIESSVLAHPRVRDAAVTVSSAASIADAGPTDGSAPESRRLVAYYSSDLPIAPGDLRAHLAERLPEYMLPTHFVWLERWPLTRNGKVDRKALPSPSQQHAVPSRQSGEPRTEIERTLAGMWCQLLNVPRVGLDDEFFELGGHSLLAMRAVSRIRDVFGVDLPLEVMFANATVAVVAHALTDAVARAAAESKTTAATQGISRQPRRARGAIS